MPADRVSINDVSLRDGIQNETMYVPLDVRLKIVERLIAAGLTQVQVGSFVHPVRVPQMREVELFIERLPNKERMRYSALVLNTKGLERFMQSGLQTVDLSLSCSDTHSRKNSGLSLDEASRAVIAMIARAKSAGFSVRAGLQCVFSCPYEGAMPLGRVLEMSQQLLAAGCDSLSLADSTGAAIPTEITAMIEALGPLGDVPLIMHLHDTYGLGLANLVAAYAGGVRTFDASLGGVGGCPFIPGATGNVAMEDVVRLFTRMGVTTDLLVPPLIEATQLLETALHYELPGKVYRVSQRQARAASRKEDHGSDHRSENTES